MTNEEAVKIIEDMRNNAINLILEKAQIDALDMAIEALKAQDQALNEWCTDCKEYDKEKHCCPRFNRVIRSALEDVTETNVGDMVSRQDAIDYVDCGHLRPPTELAWSDLDVVNMLKRLPPAEQPNSSEILNSSDMVSRQAVIDALNRFSLGETDAMKLYSRMDNYLKKLQPAEPQTEINMAYMRGKIDGINYCTERLREIRMEAEHEEVPYNS